MNRGLMFYMPTAGEWIDFNRKTLGKTEFRLPDAYENNSPSGAYLLANYMPALVLRLTRPDLAWCVDADLLRRHETRINVGSSYFVMEKCVLGPTLYYSDAASDVRANVYVTSFAGEVSNGLRWILQIYRTTNILQQHDLFNMDLAIARNIRNKLAFGNYTPVKLVTELSESADCQAVPTCTLATEPFYAQPFGYSSGSSAPIGGVGQFSRPHLGAAPVGGFCSPNATDLAVRDPYVLNADDVRRLNEMIAKNRQDMTNRHYANIFRPTSGLGPAPTTRPADDTGAAEAFNSAAYHALTQQQFAQEIIPQQPFNPALTQQQFTQEMIPQRPSDPVVSLMDIEDTTGDVNMLEMDNDDDLLNVFTNEHRPK